MSNSNDCQPGGCKARRCSKTNSCRMAYPKRTGPNSSRSTAQPIFLSSYKATPPSRPRRRRRRHNTPQPAGTATAAAAMNDLAWFWCAAACVKLLLVPAYRSTDFEVHRHWLALTSSLPLSRWYVDASSPWTLDYPPLFAYFEYLLSVPAALVDPAIVDIRNLGYEADSAILFQRLSVVFADLSILVGVWRIARGLPVGNRRLVYALVLWSPVLLIVDHVHFQYNGLLLGILLLSLALLAEGRDLAGGVAFAVLICSKHLFAVAAPVYFVYLLRHYCSGGGFRRDLGRLLGMGAAVGVVFAISFGPFLYHRQVKKCPFNLLASKRFLSSVLALYAAIQMFLRSYVAR